MFDWMAALFAFFVFMALVIFICIISGIAAWVEDIFGLAAGVFVIFLFIGIGFAFVVGVCAI